VEQTTLAIEINRSDEPPIALQPEQRQRLVELMAAAILAVHRASGDNADDDKNEGDDDDVAGE
jgi:hypothetical protein